MRGGSPGAITRASCPVLRRCLSTCSTEPVTPLMCGRKDSDTTATLMQAVHQRHRGPLMSLQCRVEDEWVNTCPCPLAANDCGTIELILAIRLLLAPEP